MGMLNFLAVVMVYVVPDVLPPTTYLACNADASVVKFTVTVVAAFGIGFGE
jgi:hypothetical protein